MRHENMQIREWEKTLQFHCPERNLKGFAILNDLVAQSDLATKEKHLRGHGQEKLRERRQAALFGYGLQRLFGYRALEFAMSIERDYDAVVRWDAGDFIGYRKIELKEWVPEGINKKATFQGLLQGLRKYKGYHDVTVAVYMNRRLQGNLSFAFPPDLEIGGLFLYAGASPDGLRWQIIGDWLNREQGTVPMAYFDYPLPRSEDFA